MPVSSSVPFSTIPTADLMKKGLRPPIHVADAEELWIPTADLMKKGLRPNKSAEDGAASHSNSRPDEEGIKTFANSASSFSFSIPTADLMKKGLRPSRSR